MLSSFVDNLQVVSKLAEQTTNEALNAIKQNMDDVYQNTLKEANKSNDDDLFI